MTRKQLTISAAVGGALALGMAGLAMAQTPAPTSKTASPAMVVQVNRNGSGFFRGRETDKIIHGNQFDHHNRMGREINHRHSERFQSVHRR